MSARKPWVRAFMWMLHLNARTHLNVTAKESPQTGQCAPPLCKNCPGTAWGTQQRSEVYQASNHAWLEQAWSMQARRHRIHPKIMCSFLNGSEHFWQHKEDLQGVVYMLCLNIRPSLLIQMARKKKKKTEREKSQCNIVHYNSTFTAHVCNKHWWFLIRSTKNKCYKC